ncbi:hypothetical protein [Nocardioides sp.]|uniref:hypothetical protein n=1 Tax=Nocardioides sp. TaxID=35761 RepID=UPI002C6F0914|nr:hypothetical protein [Nocardioides sp.]HXH79912.1 hypothetical protein [Nocardioides sp.]
MPCPPQRQTKRAGASDGSKSVRPARSSGPQAAYGDFDTSDAPRHGYVPEA